MKKKVRFCPTGVLTYSSLSSRRLYERHGCGHTTKFFPVVGIHQRATPHRTTCDFAPCMCC
ncbi:unnamed protein product, partial [Ectocarpus sp. 12 AP-2014]